MIIDKDNETVVFQGKKEIELVAAALRHCYKQDVFYDEDYPGWHEFMYESYDKLFEAFISKPKQNDGAS